MIQIVAVGIALLVGTTVISGALPDCKAYVGDAYVGPGEDQSQSPPSPPSSEEPSLPPPQDPSPPEPDPPSPPSGELNLAQLHGVNYFDKILHSKFNNMPSSTDPASVEKYLSVAEDSNFNILRIPVLWESYEADPQVFMDQLAITVSKADQRGMAVWIEVHHFYATSTWAIGGGSGFPPSIIDCYNPTGDYEASPIVEQFWDDYYSNNVKDPNNNCNYGLQSWQRHADFMVAMIARVDHHNNVIGYEILNEPHTWSDDHYDKLGQMHSVIGLELRKHTDRAIIFTRETAHGFKPDGSEYGRSPSLEYKIIPQISGPIIYAPHIYDLPEIEKHVTQFKSHKATWKSLGYEVAIMIGEYATQPPQLPEGQAVTQENMDGFVSVWHREGWAHTYWAFGDCCGGEGNRLVTTSGVLTQAGVFYKNAIETYYGNPAPLVLFVAAYADTGTEQCTRAVSSLSSVFYSGAGIAVAGLFLFIFQRRLFG